MEEAGYGLATFRTLAAAKEWARNGYQYAILRVEVEGKMPEPFMMDFMQMSQWNRTNLSNYSRGYHNWPFETVIYRRVRPVKVVKVVAE
jgi:hypothetical protein